MKKSGVIVRPTSRIKKLISLGLIAGFAAGEIAPSGIFPDEQSWPIVRGGTNTLEQWQNQQVDSMGKLVNASVQYGRPFGTGVKQISMPIARYKKVGIADDEDFFAMGGKLTYTPSTPRDPSQLPNPYHFELSGITPEQAFALFSPAVPNPALLP